MAQHGLAGVREAAGASAAALAASSVAAGGGLPRHGAGPPPGGIGVTAHQKVNDGHLRRDAYPSIDARCSSTESTMRQYALRDRAVALGWPSERVIVIDSDPVGGFGCRARRVPEAGGRGRHRQSRHRAGAGGLAAASDWHRLLEICALTDTLILDEDAPADFNDRLARAERHDERGGVARAARAAARRRAESGRAAPTAAGGTGLRGGRRRGAGSRRTGASPHGVGFGDGRREQDLRFPRRPRSGPHQGEVVCRYGSGAARAARRRLRFGRTRRPLVGGAMPQAAARAVDGAVARRASGLHRRAVLEAIA